MNIGILEVGLLNEKLNGSYDRYSVMFAKLLDRAGGKLSYQAYSVIQGEMPASIYDCDGWLITGSRHGVYENLDWMLKLQDFIGELAQAEIPLVGICFGHQIIAQALGGEVAKSDKGWGVGLQHYRIDQAQPWMSDAPKHVGIYAFHQDQVVKCPQTASVFSSSDFCPYAGLSYGNSIISVQAHPEFSEDYEHALLDIYGGDIVPAKIAESARETMSQGDKADTQMLASWLSEFFLSRQSVCTAKASNI
jgi:GMP synthase-like glutamine amidotransferase